MAFILDTLASARSVSTQTMQKNLRVSRRGALRLIHTIRTTYALPVRYSRARRAYVLPDSIEGIDVVHLSTRILMFPSTINTTNIIL